MLGGPRFSDKSLECKSHSQFCCRRVINFLGSILKEPSQRSNVNSFSSVPNSGLLFAVTGRCLGPFKPFKLTGYRPIIPSGDSCFCYVKHRISQRLSFILKDKTLLSQSSKSHTWDKNLYLFSTIGNQSNLNLISYGFGPPLISGPAHAVAARSSWLFWIQNFAPDSGEWT